MLTDVQIQLVDMLEQILERIAAGEALSAGDEVVDFIRAWSLKPNA
jgi:hypothetical protein